MSRRHGRRKGGKKKRTRDRVIDLAEAGIRFDEAGDYVRIYLESPEALKLAPMMLPPPRRRGIARDGSEVWVYYSPNDAA